MYLKQENQSNGLAMEALSGAMILCLSSHCFFDAFPIPITLQTCAVQIISFFMTPYMAFLSVGLWIFLGAVGFPGFALGHSGILHLFGLRGGYIWGFLCAAPFISLLYRFLVDSGRCQWLSFAISSVLGHIIILSLGWLFVFCNMGCSNAWNLAFKPFLSCVYTKTVVFSFILCFLHRLYRVLYVQKNDHYFAT